MSRLTFCFPSGAWPALLLCVGMLYHTPAWSAATYGECGQGNDATNQTPVNFHIDNLSFPSDRIPAAGELYTSPPVTITYRCTQTGSYPHMPALYNTASFRSLYDILRKAGLNLQLLINGQVWTPDTSTAGMAFQLPPTYTADSGGRKVTLQYRLFRDPSVPVSAVRTTVPGGNHFVLWPIEANYGLPGWSGIPVSFNTFTLQYIPDCIGRVSITPSQINLGHVMTGYLDKTLPKQASITITAAVNKNCAGAGLFDMTLHSQFSTTDALTGDSRAIQLKNNKGELNGLRLYFRDPSAYPPANVPLNTPQGFGNIIAGVRDSVTRNYTAVVDAIPGSMLKTGPFSADVVVTITYE
ncbi:fimbrial protein [Salmonella enterica]|nr:fimbrial protein [Salmonella enterica]